MHDEAIKLAMAGTQEWWHLFPPSDSTYIRSKNVLGQ